MIFPGFPDADCTASRQYTVSYTVYDIQYMTASRQYTTVYDTGIFFDLIIVSPSLLPFLQSVVL